MTLTGRQLAAAFGVRARQVGRWVADGCPVLAPGGPGRAARFDLREVIGWYVARELAARAPRGGDVLDPRHERARRDRAAADALELRNRLRRGECVEVVEVVRVWRELLAEVRAQLLALPTRLAPVLAPETDARLVADRLTTAVTDCLRGLARWRPPGAPEAPPP